MKIVILGARGMIGHSFLEVLGASHNVVGTVRGGLNGEDASITQRLIGDIDVQEIKTLECLLLQEAPDVVINCTGVIKQKSQSVAIADQIHLNSVTPHLLAELAASIGFRLVILSSDCVFSGREGNYSEKDVPDALDLYGQTKALGEVNYGNCLTLRTSTIGLEVSAAHGLVEWFLNQDQRLVGFNGAVYSGLTTTALARYTEHLLANYPNLNGLYQAAAAPITKYDLLTKLSAKLGLDLEIEKDEKFQCDRRLDGSVLKRLSGYQVPSWDEMLDELAIEIKARG